MDDESEVLERAAAWQRSIEERDVAAAGRYLDDDYALELVEPDAAMFRRDAWLAIPAGLRRLNVRGARSAHRRRR